MRLRGDPPISVSIVQRYRIFQNGDRPWAAATVAYHWAILDGSEREIIAYHWNPEQRVAFPHLHLGPAAGLGTSRLHKIHLPTGYLVLPDIIGLLITQFVVRPRRADWKQVLERFRAAAPTVASRG